MKYLGMCILIFSISTLNIFGDEDLCDGVNIIFVQNLTVEQQEEAAKMREEFLQEFNEIRNKIINIRMETQIEMRKEKPDWDEIKKLNREYSKLQNTLNKGILEYKDKMQTINIEVVN
jgi:phage regulator Rha-like protein